MKATADSGRPR